MRERILHILGRSRRRVLAVRSAEAAAVAGVGAALAAACLMAGKILAGRYPAAGAGLCAAPLAGALVLALWRRPRRALSARPLLQWYVIVLLAACGAGGLAAALTGALAGLPKNALFLIVPVAAAVGAGIVLARPVPLGDVAVLLDRRAGLAERLSTAWELHQGRDESAFARAVQDQAAAAARDGALGRARFWDRTRATLGALGLALAAAALMLPWEPLESPAARRARLWRQAGPQAAELLEPELPALDPETIASVQDLEPHLRRLEAVTNALRSARPQEAGEWLGRVIELDRIAQALREVIRSGRADPAATRRLERLLYVIERASAELAAAMSGPEAEVARTGSSGVEPEQVVAGAPGETPPAEWTTVFNPHYVGTVEPKTSTQPAGDSGDEPRPAPQVPYDRQWAAARDRADNIGAGAVPRQYHQLVRDFFAPQD